MRSLPPALAGHLAGGVTTLCRCWILTRRDALSFGFTDHDRDLVLDGVTCAAASGLAPSEVEQQTGLAVSTGEIGGALADSRLTEADIEAGHYDDAEVATWLVNWAAPDERVLLEVASIGEIRRADRSFIAELRGPMHRYDQEQGRLYTRACSADLGDAACGLNIEALAVNGTVSETDGRLALAVAAIAAFDAGHFTAGRVKLTGGANAGAVRMIQQHGAGGELALWEPFPRPIQPGDTVRLYPGCDKDFETCGTRFDNRVNFRGFPHIPTPDFILTYARPGEGGHDGGLIDP